MCVVVLVRLLDSNPPIARTAPMMASLSPLGISAQVTVSWLKNRAGSGVKGLMGACLPRRRELETHAGVTTATIWSRAAEYCGKSIDEDMMCVRRSKSTTRSGPATFTSPFLPIIDSASYSYVSTGLRGELSEVERTCLMYSSERSLLGRRAKTQCSKNALSLSSAISEKSRT
jgi:hypothetical protein